MATERRCIVIPLPPKRFQNYQDPQFDPIRHKYWFARLEGRRKDLSTLMAAVAALGAGGKTLAQIAVEWAVSPVDLTYCRAFVEGRSRVAGLGEIERKASQSALDEAYAFYVRNKGNTPFNEHLSLAAKRFGLSPDKLVDLWETDPVFYPQHYKKD